MKKNKARARAQRRKGKGKKYEYDLSDTPCPSEKSVRCNLTLSPVSITVIMDEVRVTLFSPFRWRNAELRENKVISIERAVTVTDYVIEENVTKSEGSVLR